MLWLQYATVRGYFGWPEFLHYIRPVVPWFAAGMGFGVIYLAHRARQKWQRKERRKGRDRRRLARMDATRRETN